MSTLIEHPLVTEKAMNDMDFENKLQFVVNPDATKPEIRDEVEERFEVSVTDINTQVTMKGKKKAIVKLAEDDDAQEVASRIGVF
ncbi:50S ribosomal protein L23 [Natrialba magadii ATCC 43099]|uniref:Large ribosomal subunit protein uL23 n=3 Tax=Natrialba TaxID=63742 RepID=D3SWL2_NATMM|nr:MULTISPECIES: 50S ribosomal protein L23 [Natrialba]ADD03804.1 50S ribosomal protein L23 [Natrialba magadii ATCC 43099]ELY33858.1 50S ribosomal protein L23P [Natrialba magadii ATCC 43099]ELY95231.1 50S ribosomal protein L23P [Natrialba hulunbeirensis JCM 10989]ELY97499.1 50S ribosomal protein L23P [Natrialba chahannaoensis JCM 10990]OIB59164.1 50S ribosomal protein L23 [Natrialba sp. SSL1]